MIVLDGLSIVLISLGGFFFFAGTLGVWRFRSALNRLHAVTKADNLGLGLIVLGLMLQADSLAVALKLLMIWSLVLLSAATVSHLIGQRAYPAEKLTLDSDYQDSEHHKDSS